MIFDPGIDDSTMLLDAVYTELSLAYGMRPASLREGQFSVNGDIARMFNVLFDSGALHHSYINAGIVEKHLLQQHSLLHNYLLSSYVFKAMVYIVYILYLLFGC